MGSRLFGENMIYHVVHKSGLDQNCLPNNCWVIRNQFPMAVHCLSSLKRKLFEQHTFSSAVSWSHLFHMSAAPWERMCTDVQSSTWFKLHQRDMPSRTKRMQPPYFSPPQLIQTSFRNVISFSSNAKVSNYTLKFTTECYPEWAQWNKT